MSGWFLLASAIVQYQREIELFNSIQFNKAHQILRKTNISYPPSTHAYVRVSGDKKCSFFGKFGMLCFLETPVLTFALLPYYRRVLLLKHSS